jgi:prepilin-type N-terminal cleavage/methylation domain-containing protein
MYLITRRSGPRGFTMLELIIVITIVGLLVAMAVPAFSRSLLTNRTVNASTVVQGDIELAFAYAARQRRPVRIAWSSSTMTYTISDRRNGTTFVRRSLGSGSEFTLSSVTFSASPVDIYPGGIASGALTVTLTGGSTSVTVTMTRAGLVRVS